jgi:hypothetical protein
MQAFGEGESGGSTSQTPLLDAAAAPPPPPTDGEGETAQSGSPLTIVPFCTADGSARTTVGVGEAMAFHCSESDTTWSATGGTGSTERAEGSADSYSWTAPDQAGTFTISVTKEDGSSGSVDITVLAPTGMTATSTGSVGVQGVGAGMGLEIQFAPTSVSFAGLEWFEVPASATGAYGYFEEHTPLDHDASQGAGVWHSIGDGNKVTDQAGFGYTFTPYRAGGYTWSVPNQWRVAGSGAAHDLVTTSQVHTIHADHSATVSKHGVTSAARQADT